MVKRTVVFIFLAVVLMLSGCARYPDNPVSSGKQLVITLRVAGKIATTDEADPGIRRYYYIAIDNDGDTNSGPWAVVAPPYGGNGWVTSADASRSIGVTSYVVYDAESTAPSVYGILPGSYFLSTTAPRPPVKYEIIDGGSTLRITLDLSQVATSSISTDKISQLNFNFITTDQLAINPSYSYPNRHWDALGADGQDYVSIDTTQTQVWSGDDDSGDVNDPDLDIIKWTVEVQNVSSG